MLVVDDDPTIGEVASDYLRAAGLVVELVSDGFAALAAVERDAPDMIVLDRMLPGVDGLEICRRIRESRATPILMLTALGSEEDRITGLEAGADDYLAKPFSPRELVLRVQSILRRTIVEFAPEAPIELGGFRVDTAARVATLNGETLSLTVREFDLLAFLLRRPNQAFDRETLLSAVWGWTYGDLSTVTVHVRRLREKIEVDPSSPKVLVTVWGVGYRCQLAEDANALV